MKKRFILSFLIFLCQTSFLFAQQPAQLKITGTKSSFSKVIQLPVNTRIVKQNDDVVLLRLDSIKNGYWYGNKGKDSIAIGEIRVVHLRGLKEALKYSAMTACLAITAGATYFTIYAFNYPVTICDGGGCDNGSYKYIGMSYMAVFGGLATALYHYPRTRFKTSKYTFLTE